MDIDSAAPQTGLVVGGASGLGADITRALCAHGAKVGVVEEAADDNGAPPVEGVTVFGAHFDEVESVKSAFRRASNSLGRPTFVVHALFEPRSLDVVRLTDMPEADFELLAERPIRSAMFAAQAAYDEFGDFGGRLVFIAPTAAQTGAYGLGAAATAGEGLHLLTKTVARQWSARGIRSYCIEVPVESLASAAQQEAFAALPPTTPWPPAIGRGPDAVKDIGDVVSLVLDERAGFLTGATLVVDGGKMMMP